MMNMVLVCVVMIWVVMIVVVAYVMGSNDYDSSSNALWVVMTMIVVVMHYG
jgi:hypothetical protein